MAGGNNSRQRKSSFSFLFVFNIFKSNKKAKGGQRDGFEAGTKVWPSDYDKGSWGIAEPGIDKKAAIFIARQKKRASDLQRDPAA